ncbi:MAG: hypothetical protein NZT92_15770 [Abditibacteriales bacterium]|nr:hypothetical protein [Abditibacteriales bacterium]MDW8364216.1 hypothetical protein [Abditibacteriales bacterium]
MLYTDPQAPVGTLDRQTWSGAELPYQIDADGLVTPPVYVHDKTAKTKALAKIALAGGDRPRPVHGRPALLPAAGLRDRLEGAGISGARPQRGRLADDGAPAGVRV